MFVRDWIAPDLGMAGKMVRTVLRCQPVSHFGSDISGPRFRGAKIGPEVVRNGLICLRIWPDLRPCCHDAPSPCRMAPPMRRWVLVALFSCCCTLVRAVSADEGTPPPASATLSATTAPPSAASSAPSPQAIQAAFSTLVALGDKARKEGQFTDAMDAYRKALALRDDPVLVGKLGLIYAIGGAPEMATRNLLVALERGGGTPIEKKEFFRVFQQTRPHVCLLHVLGNVFDAEVSIDASPFRKEMGPTFKLFVMPGKHVVRGRAPNGDEAVAEKECPKGGEETATLQWNLPARVEAVESLREEEEDAPPPATPMRPGRLLKVRIERDPMLTAVDDEPPPRGPIVGGVLGEQKKPPPRGAIGGGAAFVFGVASWGPAVGVALHGSARPIEAFSIDLDVRAAWLTSGIGGEPIKAMSVGGLLSACGHWRWFFGCGSGYLGAIRIDANDGRYQEHSYLFVKPGLGGRLGGIIRLAPTIGLQLSAEIIGLNSGIRVVVNRATLTDQPPLMMGANVLGVWEF